MSSRYSGVEVGRAVRNARIASSEDPSGLLNPPSPPPSPTAKARAAVQELRAELLLQPKARVALPPPAAPARAAAPVPAPEASGLVVETKSRASSLGLPRSESKHHLSAAERRRLKKQKTKVSGKPSQQDGCGGGLSGGDGGPPGKMAARMKAAPSAGADAPKAAKVAKPAKPARAMALEDDDLFASALPSPAVPSRGGAQPDESREARREKKARKRQGGTNGEGGKASSGAEAAEAEAEAEAAGYAAKRLKCRDCAKQFVFSAAQQQRLASRGHPILKTRCFACAAHKKNRFGGAGKPGRAGAKGASGSGGRPANDELQIKRGVCQRFAAGKCTLGASCKFSHVLQQYRHLI